jgi:hypothetical protein
MPTKTRKTTARRAATKPRITKRDQVIDLLRRPEGATAKQIMDATGWQAHTVRGFIAALRKGKSGKREFEAVAVETVREEGRTVYRAAPATD